MTNELGEYSVADTQYNDLVGTIAVDGSSSPPLVELARLAGVDTEKYLLLHVHSSIYIEVDDEVPMCGMTFFAADLEVQGSDYEAVMEYARENDNTLPVIKISGDPLPLLDVLKVTKRVGVALTLKSIEHEGIKLHATNQSDS